MWWWEERALVAGGSVPACARRILAVVAVPKIGAVMVASASDEDLFEQYGGEAQ